MPNDAKLGLVIGVSLVLLIAVVFFRKDTLYASGAGPAIVAAPVAVQP